MVLLDGVRENRGNPFDCVQRNPKPFAQINIPQGAVKKYDGNGHRSKSTQRQKSEYSALGKRKPRGSAVNGKGRRWDPKEADEQGQEEMQE